MPKPISLVVDGPVIYYDAGQSPFVMHGRVFNVQNANHEWSLQRASNKPIYRFEARQGDNFGGLTDRVRSEVQCSTKEPVSGVDVWVSYAVNISAPTGILSTSMVIGQFHQTEDAGDFSGYPPFEINLKSDGLYIYTASVPEALKPTSYLKTQRAGPLSFDLDSWNRVVIRCRFGWSSDGALDVWINGESIYSASGINVGMNDSIGPYWKHGIYWAPDDVAQTVVARYANFEIGSQSLINRVLNPLKIPSSI